MGIWGGSLWEKILLNVQLKEWRRIVSSISRNLCSPCRGVSGKVFSIFAWKINERMNRLLVLQHMWADSIEKQGCLTKRSLTRAKFFPTHFSLMNTVTWVLFFYTFLASIMRKQYFVSFETYFSRVNNEPFSNNGYSTYTTRIVFMWKKYRWKSLLFYWIICEE